jgi:cbb3-type cytochrome oxidase maturation protein
MPMGLWVVIGWMALVSISGLILIAWGLKTHQFDDIEGSKLAMLEDCEPQDWPGRAGTEGGAKSA